MLSSCTGPYPLEKVGRYTGKDQRKVQVSRPGLIRNFNNAMGGGGDLVKAAVRAYRHGSREEVVMATFCIHTRCSDEISMENFSDQWHNHMFV